MRARVHCYACQRESALAGPPAGGAPPRCPACGSEFCELLEAALPPPHAPPPGAMPFDFGAFGVPEATFGPLGSGGASISFGIGGGSGGVRFGRTYATGNGAAAHNEFERSVLEALLGAGMGGFGGGRPAAFRFVPAGFDAAGEQAWLDQIISQVMEQYEPRSTATDARVLRSLPRLAVRPRAAPEAAGGGGGGGGAQESLPEGAAAARAGEACAVCCDEYGEGEEVLELPCQACAVSCHCFHEGCILPWLEGHNTCPVCRMELRPAARSASAGNGLGAAGGRAAGVDAHASGPGLRQRSRAAGGGGGEGGGGLHGLLGSIAEAWNSYRHPEEQSPRQQEPHSVPVAGGSASWRAGAGAGGAAAASASAAATAPLGGGPRSAAATGSGAGGPAAGAGAPSHRPSAAAAAGAAAARRAPAAGSVAPGGATSGAAAAAAAPRAPPPPAWQNAPQQPAQGRQQQQQQQQQHPPRQQQQQQPQAMELDSEDEEEIEVPLATVVGGALGALAGSFAARPPASPRQQQGGDGGGGGGGGSGASRRRAQEQEEEEAAAGRSLVGLVVGGTLGALAGTALSGLLGGHRGRGG